MKTGQAGQQIGNFNFIKVRLKLYTAEKMRLEPKYFNSIKVRLKLSCSNPYTVSSSQFQFHKGTIKT